MPEAHLVSFYRRIVGDGLRHLTRIDQIEVPTTPAGQDTASAAIAKFERKHDVDDWRELADRYRVKTA